MSDVLIPVLEDLKNRLVRIEETLKEMQEGKTAEQKGGQGQNLPMDEINDYLQKIHMA